MLNDIAYEGNIQFMLENIIGEEIVRKLWEAVCRGEYRGYGETYMDPSEVLWWPHGGTLRSESWKRVCFLLDNMKETSGIGLALQETVRDDVCAVPEDFVQVV